MGYGQSYLSPGQASGPGYSPATSQHQPATSCSMNSQPTTTSATQSSPSQSHLAVVILSQPDPAIHRLSPVDDSLCLGNLFTPTILLPAPVFDTHSHRVVVPAQFNFTGKVCMGFCKIYLSYQRGKYSKARYQSIKGTRGSTEGEH